MAFNLVAPQYISIPVRDGSFKVTYINIPITAREKDLFKQAEEYSCLFDSRWNELHVYRNGMRVEKFTLTGGIIPYTLIVRTLSEFLAKELKK